jgi:hypothetical protein
MGIGYSEHPNITPIISTRLILTAGSYYEMLSPFDWHYVRPIDEPSYSIMLSGKQFNPEAKPERPELRALNDMARNNLLEYFRNIVIEDR